jgi:hypothetical protein
MGTLGSSSELSDKKLQNLFPTFKLHCFNNDNSPFA